jgi:hypothetical protein
MSKDKYSKYVPLFGDADDKRPRFFISQLLEQAIMNRKNRTGGVGKFVENDCMLTTVTEQLKSKNFIPPDVGNNEHVHSEWKTFLCDAMSHPIDTVVFVGLIRELAGVQKEGSLEELMQIVMRKLTGTITGTGGDICDDTSKWRTASTATVASATERLNKLVSVTDLPLATSGNQLHAEVTSACAGGHVKSPKKYFNHDLDKLTQNELIAAAHELNTQPVSVAWNESTKKMGGDEFFRNAKGELCMKKNNEDVSIDVGSNEYRRLVTIDNKCGTTGLVGDREVCANFLMKCLAGKDINKCKEFLVSNTYWPSVLDEVKNMNPMIAVNLLEAFEFSKEPYTELVKDTKTDKTQNMKLNKFQCVGTWLESIKSKVTTDEYNSINGNDRLKGYLNLVRERVNNNPIILNPNYKLTNIIVDDYPDKESSLLYKYGVPLRREPISMNNINRVQNVIRTYNDRLRLRLNIIPSTFGTILTPMMGGSTRSNEHYSSRVEDMPRYTSGILLQELNDYKARLKQYNKSISSNDDKKLNDLLKSLAESEEKLYKFIAYTDKYVDLLELHGQSDGDSVLSYDNLKKFVDARETYFKKVSNKQTNLLSILQELVNVINNQSLKK